MIEVENDMNQPKAVYHVKKELFDEAKSIRDQMKLIESRLKKMEEHRSEVSDAVYLKVKSDYQCQIDSVKGDFQGKCQEIKNELKIFYRALSEEEETLSSHQEKLEEAKFRHFLGEYEEKKFKKIEEKENKDILEQSTQINTIKDAIAQYEDILGTPYKVEEEIVQATPSRPKILEEVVEKIASDRVQIKNTQGPIAAPSVKMDAPEEDVVDDLDLLLQEEGDYFSSEPNRAEPEKEKEKEKEKAVTKKRPKPAPQSIHDMDMPDESISTILRDIPLEAEVEKSYEFDEEAIVREGTDSEIEVAKEAVLELIEGHLDENKFILGENTSIGRSPANDIVLKESRVSRQHAAINLHDGDYVIVDLKSSNGIRVNDEKVEEATLQDGDEVGVGGFKFVFHLS